MIQTIALIAITLVVAFMVSEVILMIFFDEDEDDGKEDWWE